ncbi:MAG: hypothetical protein JWQ49_791 [Edaphobacter sp.]|nr:hypothetical protein [Edaphobacter sp.]
MWKIEVDTPPETYEQCEGHAQYPKVVVLNTLRQPLLNVRVIPTSNAMEESVDLAHEIYNRVFRKDLND